MVIDARFILGLTLLVGVVILVVYSGYLIFRDCLWRYKDDDKLSLYLIGVQKGEEYLQEYGLQSAEDYIKQEIPINFITQVDKGFIDYIDYYKEHLHNGIMLPLSNINKDNNPQGDKMVTLPKDFDQACKNFHTIEESRWKQAIRKKINNRKQELSKFGFKENIRW